MKGPEDRLPEKIINKKYDIARISELQGANCYVRGTVCFK